MKRLTGLKHGNSASASVGGSSASRLRRTLLNNNPYPESGLPLRNGGVKISESRAGRLSGVTSASGSHDARSIGSYDDARSTRNGRVLSTRSAAPTVATNPGTIHSSHSRAGTAYTGVGALSYRDGGRDSTFSSPQQSQESLTTTVTTLQSTAASAMLGPHGTQPVPGLAMAAPANQANQAHISPFTTYHAATANNILTDNASVMTLASSTRLRRRNSLDTNASVRALAPSSVYGASRESLPLSLLSTNHDGASTFHGIAGPSRPPVLSAAAERASVYSSSGVAPIINSERNSYYAAKQQNLDAVSVRSGLLGHGKADSISGSLSGILPPGIGSSSPLASPRDRVDGSSLRGGASRRNSDWQEEDATEEDGLAKEPLEKISKGKGSLVLNT
jgi:hypothetical protein